jgi:predicted DNA-binding transcriptional regulator AlpA
MTEFQMYVMSGTPQIMDTEQLAEFLGWSKYTVIVHRTKGTGPKWSKIGRSIRYQLMDVLDWLNSLKDGDE